MKDRSIPHNLGHLNVRSNLLEGLLYWVLLTNVLPTLFIVLPWMCYGCSRNIEKINPMVISYKCTLRWNHSKMLIQRTCIVFSGRLAMGSPFSLWYAWCCRENKLRTEVALFIQNQQYPITVRQCWHIVTAETLLFHAPCVSNFSFECYRHTAWKMDYKCLPETDCFREKLITVVWIYWSLKSLIYWLYHHY